VSGVRRFRTPLLVLLAALLAVPVVVRIVFPKQKLIRMLVSQVETSTAWRASVGDASIGLFPPSIRIEDLALSGDPAYEDSSEIRIPRARAQADLGSFFRGSLQVTRVTIERPVVRLATARRAAGMAGREAARDRAQPKSGFPLALSLSRLEIIDGSFAFRDTTGFAMTLDSLAGSMSISAARGFERIVIPGSLSSGSVAVTMPIARPAAPPGTASPGAAPAARVPSDSAQTISVGGLRAAGEFRVAYLPRENILEIESAAIRVNELPATVSGRVTALDSIPISEIVVEAKDASIAALLSLVPDDVLAQKSQLDAAGTATIVARFTGPMAPPGAMRVEGSAVIAGGRVAYRGLPGAVEALAASVRFTQDRVDIDSLAALFEGEPLRVKGAIVLAAVPTVDLDIDGVLPLDRIGKWPVLTAVEALGGTVRLRVHAAGPASPPQALRLDGAIDFENVRATPRGWSAPIEGISGRVRLAGNVATIDGLVAKIGASDLRIDGSVTDPLAKRPNARLAIVSRMLDLDALAVAAGAPPAAPAGAAAIAAPLLLPELPDALATIEIRADSLVAQKIGIRDARGRATLENRALHAVFTAGAIRVPETPLSDARADVTIKDRRLSGDVSAARVQVGKVPLSELSAKIAITPDGVVDITGGRARAFSGSLAGDVRIALGGAEPRYTFRVKGTDLEMNDFLSRLTPLKDAFFGKMELAGDFEGEGLTAAEAVAKLKATGTALAANGRVTPNPVLAQLAQLLGVAELRQINFRTMKSGFRVGGGRVSVDDFAIDAPDAKWNLAGSVGFDGTLDYRLDIRLSKPLADRAIARAGDFARAFADEKGELLVPLVIGGTALSPSVTVDVSKAMSRARGNTLRDAARSLGVSDSVIKDPIKALNDPKAISGLLDRLGGKKSAVPDCTAARDTTR